MTRLGASNFAQDFVTGRFIPGFGKFRSAAVAYGKCWDLTEVLQAYFQDTTAYDGSPIDEDDSKKAIKYVISKKMSKAGRQTIKGTVIFGAGVTGAAMGATVGSVVPGAGTVAGGVGGLVALDTVASLGVGASSLMVRGLKAAYKSVRGTRGEHRKQAARALDHCARTRGENTYGQAAEEALQIILGAEYSSVMAKGSDDAIERIAKRIRSV